MEFSRRALLLAPALALTAPTLATRTGRAAGPAAAGPFRIVAVPGERVEVSLRSAPGTVSLPAARARLATLAFGADRAALVAFGVEAGPSVTCDLIAVVGADAAGLRLLALEVLGWRRDDGAHLDTKASVAPDGTPDGTPNGTRLLLARAAARPEPGKLLWRRESWTDALAWRPGQAMADAAFRPAPPGTWQASLAEGRTRVRAMLETARLGLDDALLAAATHIAPPVDR